MLDVEALGDAAALLARRRSYRELPMQWVISQVQRVGGWTVLGSQTFPMHITPSSLYGQLSFARDEANKVGDHDLRRALIQRANRLHEEAGHLGTHRRAHSYAIVLQRT